jgi:hypothetical protein
MSTRTKQGDQFIQQLRELVSRQEMTIPIIETHEHNSVTCSGDIIAIQVVCQCSKSSDTTDDQVKRPNKIDSSKDVSFQALYKIISLIYLGCQAESSCSNRFQKWST